MTLQPLPAAQALDAYYLEARALLLDLAAIFDRIDRGGQIDDLRHDRLREALKLLLDHRPHRAEMLQELFSLPYDAGWKKPVPRTI